MKHGRTSSNVEERDDEWEFSPLDDDLHVFKKTGLIFDADEFNCIEDDFDDDDIG